MFQDMIGTLIPSFRRTDSWSNTLIGSALAVGAWGYFLYEGVIDPMGGINTLWPLFGISNQMLAAIALVLCTVVLIKMKRERYAWVTAVPTLWLLTCTLTAGLQKLLSSVPAIGFLSHARLFGAAADAGRVLPPAKTIEEMNRVIFNDYVDAALAALFIAVLLAVALCGVMAIRKALADPKVSAVEVGVGAFAGATHA
jgi:carbon starvation protein